MKVGAEVRANVVVVVGEGRGVRVGEGVLDAVGLASNTGGCVTIWPIAVSVERAEANVKLVG